jgi:hypothetical protein
MFVTLTDQQHYLLELIADGPIAAIPEIERYTAPLAATNLIALKSGAEWHITPLGEAVLERPRHRLH